METNTSGGEGSGGQSDSPEIPGTPDNSLIPIGQIPELKPLSDCLPEKVQTELKLTPLEVKRVAKSLKSQIYIGEHAALPMNCLGPKCPIASSCPLQQIGKAPIGQQCPIEITLMNHWKDDYVTALDAQWDDKMERQSIMDLVEADLMQMRANAIIANEGFIMENVVGISESTGEPVYRKEKHIALEVKDMIHRRKERLLKSLIATREAKKKLGLNTGDPAKKEADLLDRARAAKLREAEDKGRIQDVKARRV